MRYTLKCDMLDEIINDFLTAKTANELSLGNKILNMKSDLENIKKIIHKQVRNGDYKTDYIKVNINNIEDILNVLTQLGYETCVTRDMTITIHWDTQPQGESMTIHDGWTARNLSLRNRSDKKKALTIVTISEIETLINKSIKDGLLSCTLNIELDIYPEIDVKLKEKGYNVSYSVNTKELTIWW